MHNFHTVVFDFDGVFTDNLVFIDEEGREAVRCSRADSLGVSQLLKYIEIANRTIDVFVLSTETNEVVSKRCQKMGITCYVGESNKSEFIDAWTGIHRKDQKNPYAGIVYFGNDINDLEVMRKAGLSFATSDAHSLVRAVATHVLGSRGGHGFVREGIEFLLGTTGIN